MRSFRPPRGALLTMLSEAGRSTRRCWRAITKIGEERWSGPTCAHRATRRTWNAGLSSPRRRAIPIAALQTAAQADRVHTV